MQPIHRAPPRHGAHRRSRHARFLFFWLPLLAAGIAAEAGGQSRGTPHTADFRQPAGFDSVLYAMGGQVPGFAGYHFENGNLVVSVIDPAQHGQAALEMVLSRLERERGRRPAQTAVRPATHAFRQLFEWKVALLMSSPSVGITQAGVCADRNRVCIGIRPGRAIADLLAKADQLGIPRAAIHVYEAAEVPPLGARGEKHRHGGTQTLKRLDTIFDPVPAGVEIDDICTIGFNAFFGTIRVFVTASHCALSFGAVVSDVFGQYDDGVRRVGVETYDPATHQCTVEGATYPCRFSDAVEVTYDDSVRWQHGRIARPQSLNVNDNNVDSAKPDFAIVEERVWPVAGDTVHRVGKTSGWWRGVVRQPCLDVVTTIEGRGIGLRCQTEVVAASYSGDSGGPAFIRDTARGENAVVLVGVVWGGTTASFWLSAMANIESDDGFGDYRTVP